MSYDFDKIIERRHTGSLKWDRLNEYFGRDDVLSMWVADMDFETPPFVIEALQQRLQHPVLGYGADPAEWWPTVQQWIKDHHAWSVERDWLCYVPGIVRGIGMAVNVFCKPDEKVIIQPPVYHPFRLTPEANGRQVVMNPLRETADGTYEMDFDNLREVCDDKCRMLILANPHNPAGIVWPRETLQQLAHFCAERGIIVISDEIHCDLALFGHHHVPFATVSDEAAQCSITFQAPTKTFNMAGIVSSYAIVINEQLRRQFYGYLEANEFYDPPLLSPYATIAAYSNGEPWRKQLVEYIEGNVMCVEEMVRELHMPVKVVRPQASYLVWLDCRQLGLDARQLDDLFLNKAHLALNNGEMFGKGGEGFMRLNVGCPRSVVRQAMTQLAEALQQL